MAKLSATRTGDTLTAAGQATPLPVIPFPDSAISVSLSAKEKGSEEKLGSAFSRMVEEDPTIQITRDVETGETILSGLGDLHLEIWVSRIASRFGVEVVKSIPKIAYRETVTTAANGQGKYKRQTGGHGQYGHCLIKLAPLGRGEGFKFLNQIKGGTIPSEFIPSVEKGVIEAMEKGVLLGFPITDMQVALYDGSYHDVDSSDIAFKIAGSMALTDGVRRAGITLLEPIMKLEITVPEEFMGVAIGDVSSKRGKILGTEKKAKAVVITSYAPLAELSGYATNLRSLTEGRGVFYMEPSHYEDVPGNIVQTMLNK